MLRSEHHRTAGSFTLWRGVVTALALLLLATAVQPALAAAQDDAELDPDPVADVSGRVVVVSTKPLDPFVIVDADAADGSGLRGYSIELWNDVADRLGVSTSWVIRDSVGEIIADVQNGEADAAIAGISMTAERETLIDFAHPYFDSGLQVAARPTSNKSTFSAIADVLTSTAVLALLGVLIALVVIVAHLVWWSERRDNPEFPTSYRQGIAEALWWSSVSIVTGGEAVKDIRRPLSRVLALSWMVMGLFLFTFVTAQAASSLTVNELQNDIQGLDDLPGRSVVTVEGTVAVDYLRDANLSTDTVATLDAALDSVAEGDHDAVVFDAPVLAYRTSTDYQGRLELAGSSFAPDPYGIALETRSDLREPINAVILELFRDGSLDALDDKWLGGGS